jgi:putative hydrolase of the HAD superfamily
MIELVGFDADDTLWHSEGYFRHAAVEFERVLGGYVAIRDAALRTRLNAVQRANLALFGYGAMSMTLSMIETAVELTDGRISGRDVHRLVQLGRDVLQHPVELLPGIREAVERVAARHRIVLVTKGDLLHQQRKVEQSGLATLFQRIEIVTEKDSRSYARLLTEFGLDAAAFAMVGNSVRSDIEPVVALGGWGIHLPYHVTWAHELEHGLAPGHARVRTIASAAELPQALASCG